MNKYKCLTQQSFSLNDYELVPLREEDLLNIKDWRNEQIDILRQKAPLSTEDQIRYYERVVRPLFLSPTPAQLLFSFLFEGKCIGYGGLVHISWADKRGEVSFLAETERALNNELYAIDFENYITIFTQIVFEDLKFNRISGETYSFRKFHISILEKFGFIREGVMRRHIIDGNTFYDSIVHGLLADDYKLKKNAKKVNFKNILVSSISKKTPLLKAVANAAKKFGTDSRVFGADTNTNCLGRHFVDQFWKMPHIKNLPIQTLIDYCLENCIYSIIPTRDGSLQYWANHAPILKEAGISVMVSSPESVNLCLDKLLFYQSPITQEFPLIETTDDIETLSANRFVVKERYGAGAKSIGINLSKDKATEHAAELDSPIFQPYISGTEVSVDAYLTQKSKVKGLVLRTRDNVVNGESQVTTTFRDQKLETLCTTFLEKIQLRGHVVMQLFKTADGKYAIIECNSRFGGASTLSIAAGLDSFYWFLLEAAGEDIEHYPFVRSEKELQLVRHPEDKILWF